jgi:hypothetical protein
MIPGSANPLLLRSAAAAGGYSISRSLRFNSADSAYLSQGTSRTPASNTSITFAFWLKLNSLTTDQQIIWAFPAAGYLTIAYYGSYQGGALWVTNDVSGADNNSAKSNGVLRDPAAWYHIVYSRPHGGNGTLYINGIAQTIQSINTANIDFFADSNRAIGRRSDNGTRYASFMLADFYCIDGQALDPTSFGEFSATTGVWMPKAYTGTYGTNGFKLDFSDNSAATATTLGKDRAGSNNWTPNNLSVTAGAGNDSLVDVPTNGSEVDTGLGGQVRGNYCTWNPLKKSSADTLSNGNLDALLGGSENATYIFGTLGITTGKFYWEITVNSVSSIYPGPGVCTDLNRATDLSTSSTSDYIYVPNGNKMNNGVYSSYGASFTGGDIVGVALDMTAGTLTFYKNGVSQGQAFSGISGTAVPVVLGGLSVTIATNFGQRPFAYTAPSGFKALCTANLPAPTIVQPSTVMDAKLYTGNGSTQTISGLGFSPDLVWIKSRSNPASFFFHHLRDTIRGATKVLYSNDTRAEDTDSAFTSFNSDGFTLASNLSQSAIPYVAWAWDAGSSTVTNTAGSISSQVRANASAGFSVVTYTGNGTSGATVGHGLGVAPGMIIVKKRNAADDWVVYHSTLGASKYLWLHSTNAEQTGTNRFGGVTPTSTVFTVGGSNSVNGNNDTYVAYCFAPVAGYSAFGSYTGNGSADGPFVYTGFRPRWVMVKASSSNPSGGGYWNILDASRNSFNVATNRLSANLSDAEDSVFNWMDILSNGFKLRQLLDGSNVSGVTYVYAAFAEHPFNFSRAR